MAIALVVVAWSQLRAQQAPVAVGAATVGQGFGGEDDRPVSRTAPVTAAAARTWLALHEPIALPFDQETSLSDVIKYIQSSIKTKDLPDGLQIYVDPAGLLEAEKTMESPVSFRMDHTTLASALPLLLKQLDLAFSVRPDGLVRVTYIASQDLDLDDPNGLWQAVIDLQNQVQQLRREVRGARVRNTSAPQFRVRTATPQGTPSGFQ